MAVAATPTDASRLFQEAVATLAFDAFACGITDLSMPERSVFFAIQWPEVWRRFYFRSDTVRRDPLVDALRTRSTPFCWSDLQSERKTAQLGSEALRLSRELGWTEGFVVPVPQGRSHCGLVSLAGPRGPLSERERSSLTVLSLCFYGRLRALVATHGFAVPPVGLSKREIECLTLVSRGASDRDLAATLSISAQTAHEYVENAKRKLGVSSRAEALAQATSLGIVAV